MALLIAIIAVTAVLVEVQGKNLDPGRQLYNKSSKLPLQSDQQRYKEIILYLTPSQIRALQEGKGLINPPQVPQITKHTQAYVHTQPQAHPQNEHFHPPLAQTEPLKIPPTQEPRPDNFVPIIPPPEYRQPENYPHNKFQPQNQHRFLQPIPFFPEPNIKEAINEPKAPPTFIPLEPIPGQEHDNQIFRDQLKEQWQNLLNQNRAHFKALATLSQYQSEKSNENKKDFHYLSQHEQNLIEQKYASDVYNLVRFNNQHQLEKEGLLQAIANSPPILVHEEVNVKHTPGITHIPVFDPTRQPFEVKVSQPYPVPLEFIRPGPGPIVETQKIEGDRPVPIAIEKHIPFTVTRNVYADRPFFVDRVVPVEVPGPIPGSLPTHYHEWHH